MISFNEKMLNLLILFFACIFGIVITFMSSALAIDIIVWLLTGTFDLTKEDIFKTTKMGFIMGSLTGTVFVIARLLKLKGF